MLSRKLKHELGVGCILTRSWRFKSVSKLNASTYKCNEANSSRDDTSTKWMLKESKRFLNNKFSSLRTLQHNANHLWRRFHIDDLNMNIKKRILLFKSFMVSKRRIVFSIPFSGKSQVVVITLSDLAGHCSFLFLSLSYLESDFLNLRLYAVSGITLSIIFQYYREKPLWIPIRWNSLFLAINCMMILYLSLIHI